MILFVGPPRCEIPPDMMGQPHRGGMYPSDMPMMPVASRPSAMPLSKQEFYRLQELERRSATVEHSGSCIGV